MMRVLQNFAQHVNIDAFFSPFDFTSSFHRDSNLNINSFKTKLFFFLKLQCTFISLKRSG